MAGNTLVRSSPEQQGISSSAILRFLEVIEAGEQEIHSLMLLRNGYVVAEGWWSPYGADIPHMMFSLSKSFTSTAVGIAVDEAYFSLDDCLTSFFPDEAPDTESWSDLQIKHLLSMSTGQVIKPFPAMCLQPNWAKGFFEVPLVHKPGSHFLYNTGATYMLSEIVQRKTGMNLLDFLRQRLFEPLGIVGASWMQSPDGISLGGIGLCIKTEDIARFGQLYLQKGFWNGRQVLSREWIEQATKAHVSNGDNPKSDWNQGYGYHFWRCQHEFYRGDGSFGQFCIVMEKYNAVLSMTAAAKDMQAVMNMVWDFLLPAFRASPLVEDKETHAKLLEKLSSLHHPPVQGQAISASAKAISAKSYMAEANLLGIEKLSVDFSESGCLLKLKTNRGNETIIVGYKSWEQGQASIFDEIWLAGSQKLVASGAWDDEKRYIVQFRLYETPYVYTWDLQFDSDKLTITIQINVSLVSTGAQVIQAVVV